MLRVATYNIEWFSSLFDDTSTLQLDQEWSARRDVTRMEQLNAIAKVIRTIDPDCLLVVEAPDTRKSATTEQSLLNFAKHYSLRLNAVLTGFSNDTQQEIALFYDNTKLSALHDPQGEENQHAHAPRFDGKFYVDVDLDDQPDPHVFSKPPLEAALVTSNGRKIRLIGVHVKSKAPHGAHNKESETRISIANRRKQLAQCMWLRRRVEGHLEASEDLIVLGDFNDGPGLDEYEKLFGQSGVEIVLGQTEDPALSLYDPHAMARLNPRDSWSPSTARFYQRRRGVYLNALLDFIMISKELRGETHLNWKIWHPFDDRACFKDDAVKDALLTASDHFPVTLDLSI